MGVSHSFWGSPWSWLWSNGSWSYNYLYKQFPITIKVVSSNSMYCEECSIQLCDEVCQWLAAGRWFSPGTPLSSTNKMDCHDMTEILLKGALNIIIITPTFIYEVQVTVNSEIIACIYYCNSSIASFHKTSMLLNDLKKVCSQQVWNKISWWKAHDNMLYCSVTSAILNYKSCHRLLAVSSLISNKEFRSPWYSWKIAELALNNNHSLLKFSCHNIIWYCI